MRCYFNLIGAHQTILDDKGVEVTSLNEARVAALEAMAELIRDGEDITTYWRRWRLETTNGSGTVLFAISLDELVC